MKLIVSHEEKAMLEFVAVILRLLFDDPLSHGLSEHVLIDVLCCHPDECA